MRVFFILLIGIVFVGCETNQPIFPYDQILGEWQSKNGVTIQFNGDSTFEVTNLQGDFFNESYKEIFFSSLRGKWRYDNSDGEWLIYTNFNRSEKLKGGYSGTLIIKTYLFSPTKIRLEFPPPGDYNRFDFYKNKNQESENLIL